MNLSKRFFTVLAAAISLFLFTTATDSFAGHVTGPVHWTYEGQTGPEHWGDLSPEFAACKEGKRQSPVDITGVVTADLEDISFDYKASPLKIINNGHTIQVNYAKGSSITIGGKKYDLLQFHFHSPSEHTVNGKHYDMVAHLVHKSNDGQLAVVAVFMKKAGQNDFIRTLWSNLPSEEGHEKTVSSVKINVKDLLPANKSYYSYHGSLTTPPCSETVSWYILKTPVEVSGSQVSTFTSLFKKDIRPVQALNGRVIKAEK